MPKAEVTLPADVSSVPTSRHFVESVLAAWDLRDVSWTATLIVSELAANAALHAGGGSFTIRVDSDFDGAVRLEVRDRSSRLPRQRSHSTEATTGRGLRLVDSLAQSWGVTPDPDGKVIWVMLSAADAAGRDNEGLELDLILGVFDDDEVLPEPRGPVAQACGAPWGSLAA